MKFLSKIVPLMIVMQLLGVTALRAQTQFVPPWGPNLAPQWAPVPQVPGVYYVPNQAHDLFRYNNQYYVYQQDRWHRGDRLNGPWTMIPQPPPVFQNIAPTYYKSPPGWGKGKKTGWGGAPAPPGQMKKSGQGGALPPGQMKKLERGGSLPPGQMKKY
jgi:hypothetical protein